MEATFIAVLKVNRALLDLLLIFAEQADAGYLTLQAKKDVFKVSVKGLALTVFPTSSAKVLANSLGDKFAVTLSVATFFKYAEKIDETADEFDLLDARLAPRLKGV